MYGTTALFRLALRRQPASRRPNRRAKGVGSIEGIDVRSAGERRPAEEERLVSVHGPVHREDLGPAAEEAAVG